MMFALTIMLDLSHESSTPYYPQANGKVEAINKVLKKMLQRIIGIHKSDWNLILYATLWEYQTSVQTATRFTPVNWYMFWKKYFPMSVKFHL